MCDHFFKIPFFFKPGHSPQAITTGPPLFQFLSSPLPTHLHFETFFLGEVALIGGRFSESRHPRRFKFAVVDAQIPCVYL